MTTKRLILWTFAAASCIAVVSCCKPRQSTIHACDCKADSDDWKTSWTVPRGILGDQAAVEADLQVPVSPLWDRKFGSTIYASIVGHGECGFVGTADRQFLAFDVRTGVVRWIFYADHPIHDAAIVDLNRDPDEGQIWFIDISGTCYCLDAAGTLVWKHVENAVHGAPNLPSFHSDLAVSAPPWTIHYVVSSGASSMSKTVALDAATGAMKWEAQVAAGADKPMYYDFGSHRMIVQTTGSAGSKAVTAFDRQNGTVLWHASSVSGALSSGIQWYSRIVLGLKSSDFSLIDPANGVTLLEPNLSVPKVPDGFAHGYSTSLDEHVLVVTTGSTIEGFASSGFSPLWAHPCSRQRLNGSVSRATIAGDHVLHTDLGSAGGPVTSGSPSALVIRDLDKGTERQRIPLGAPTYADPVVSTGVVLVTTTDGRVQAFR